MSIIISSDDELAEHFPLVGVADPSNKKPESSSAGSVVSAGSSGYGSGSCGEKRQVSRNEPSTITGAAETVIKKQKIADRIDKPGECMKHMNIELHPTLHSAWYMSELPHEASCCGARLVADTTIVHEGLVLWTRERERRLRGEGGQLELSPPKTACDICLLVLPAAEVAEHVTSHALAAYVTSVREASGCRLTLVVFGAKDYFKKSKKTKKQPKPITEIELEMALTDLIVSADCDSVLVNTSNELALLIVQFTKAIAEAPYKEAKRASDEKANFYMRGDNKNCVAVDKEGHGLSRLWQQMIAVLPSSSLEISKAICANFKSPLALYEALQSPNALFDITNIGIDRAGLPEVRYRRIGLIFAKKLQKIFEGDGDELLEIKV